MQISQSDLQAAADRVNAQAFSQAPNLQQARDEAMKAETPLETPAEGPTPRTTSFAKTLDEGHTPPANALDTIPQEQGRGSEMVEKDQPEPRLVPDGPERDAVDAQQFNRDWSAEIANASAHQQELIAAAERVQAMQEQAAQERDHDNELRMS